MNRYKIALLQAINNDGVLSLPDLGSRDVSIPLRLLAEFWVAYYWPFMAEADPIWQGQRSTRGSQTVQDVAFCPLLTQLRQTWQTDHQTLQFTTDPLPGTQLQDKCLVIPQLLWKTTSVNPKCPRTFKTNIPA